MIKLGVHISSSQSYNSIWTSKLDRTRAQALACSYPACLLLSCLLKFYPRTSGTFLDKTPERVGTRDCLIPTVVGVVMICSHCMIFFKKISHVNSFWYPFSIASFSKFSPCLKDSSMNLPASHFLSGNTVSLASLS